MAALLVQNSNRGFPGRRKEWKIEVFAIVRPLEKSLNLGVFGVF